MRRKHGGVPIGVWIPNKPGNQILQHSLLYSVEILHHNLLPALSFYRRHEKEKLAQLKDMGLIPLLNTLPRLFYAGF